MEALSAPRKASRSISPVASGTGMAGARRGPRPEEEPAFGATLRAARVAPVAPVAAVAAVATVVAVARAAGLATGGSATGVVLVRGCELAIIGKDSSGSFPVRGG